MTPHQCWSACGLKKSTERDKPSETQLSVPTCTHRSQKKPSFRLWPSRLRKVARPPFDPLTNEQQGGTQMKRMITRFTRGTPCSKTEKGICMARGTREPQIFKFALEKQLPQPLCTPRELTFSHTARLCVRLKKLSIISRKSSTKSSHRRNFQNSALMNILTQTTLHKPGTSRSVMHTIFGTTSNCSPLLSLAQHTG